MSLDAFAARLRASPQKKYAYEPGVERLRMCHRCSRMTALRPVQRIEARQFVLDQHRHHGWVSGFLWLHGLAGEGGALVGIAVVGRPVARALQDGLTMEVTRLCRRRAEWLLNAVRHARRAAIAKGYRRGLTYILASETGASLRAAGWRFLWHVPGRSWDTPSRPRIDKHPTEDKHAYGWGDWPAAEGIAA